MILRAAWIVPVDSPPLHDAYIEIAGARIVGLGPARSLPAAPAQDLGEVILIPGLVNPHTHLELTAYAGQLAPAPFWDWIARLVELRRQPGRVPREQAGVQAGAWQSLRAGVTCVGDISRENIAWRVLKPMPIRKVCFAELLTLASEPPRNPAELRAAVADIAEDELLTAGVTPHAPYTVPETDLRAALALADELDRPWCTHWAETPEEVAFLAGRTEALPAFLHGLLVHCGVRSPELTPGAYLERCAAHRRSGLLAHMNYAEPNDMARLAAAGHAVVYCPRAHRFFGHAAHPWRRLQAAGAKVVIGTDSAASNQSLSMLDELRFVRHHVADAPPPEALLRMATLDAARALRLEDRIGSLSVGKAADLAAFPCPAGTADPVSFLIDAAPAPLGVWVAGRRAV